MNRFENQIITAIKKIRNDNRRQKIFETITKESASNIALQAAQQKLREIQSSSKLRNTPYQGLDSHYIVQIDTSVPVVSNSDILGTFCNETVTDSDIDLNISGGKTSAMVRSKTADTTSELSQNNHLQLVAIKTYFMNEIDVLRNEIIPLYQHCGDKKFSENNAENSLKSHILFSQE